MENITYQMISKVRICNDSLNVTDKNTTSVADEDLYDYYDYYGKYTFKTGSSVVFMVVSAVLLCVGLFGNIATMIIIRLREEFHSTTYTAIGLLAFVDLVAVCLRGIYLVDVFHYTHEIWELTLSVNVSDGIITANFVTFVCSCIHVVILVRLRYQLIAFPLEGMSIKQKSLVYQSILAWSISCILGILYGLSFLLNRYDQRIFDIIIAILVCLCTVIPIVTYHILKIRSIRKRITPRTNTVRSMNKMVVAICVVQTVSTTSSGIATILVFVIGFNIYVGWSAQLLLLMNHVMNPIMFFYFTTCRRIPNLTRNNTIQREQQGDTRV